MVDIIDVISESVGISDDETSKRVANQQRYVVAGSNADFTKPVHILLKEAVRDVWPDVTVDPAAADILFSNTWFTDSRDVEMIFLHSVDDRSLSRRSVDWRFMQIATFVDIHIFARGVSVDEEPSHLFKTRMALENVIETNKTRLIPNASIVLESSNYIPGEDNTQNVWHWLYSCGVRYAKTPVVAT